MGAYSGEHGVYGIVLVTALIAAEIEAESDLDVILFLVGTVGVFWLAHIYAAVVASRGTRPVPPLRQGIAAGIRHSAGMAVSMLVPVLFLASGALGILDEWPAYWLALASGVVILGVIGYANARRNGSTWPWRILGVLVTTGLGVVVIVLSILVH
jgi:positive regulator of sigma E activity